MKKLICILLILALAGCGLTACDRRSPAADETGNQNGNFDPETTAVGGLTQAVEEQGATELDAVLSEDITPDDIAPDENADSAPETEQDIAEDQPIVDEDPAVEAAAAAPTPDAAMPFTTPTPQPNASVSRYSEISASGLGFRFSYPSDWINIPGRSTVCYVQPLENGTVYPARVAVTMKRLPHKTDWTEVRDELLNYLKTLRTQYDEATFKVDTNNVDTETRFMGNRSIGTTYVAYDGTQEIKGYTVATYFERYMFVFHFLCAYEDYDSFEATLRYMRDSVQADDNLS